jgi:formylglycine-generating enzyme
MEFPFRLALFAPVTVALGIACSTESRDFSSSEGGGSGQPTGSGGNGTGAGSAGTAGNQAGGGGSAAECTGSEKDCMGNRPRSCVGGRWVEEAPCENDIKFTCLAGSCVGAPSCVGLLDANCGANDVNCCSSPKIDGTTFNRNFAPGQQTNTLPATVSDFRLDIFEVTVARFRTFVQAGQGTQGTPPAPDAGAHPAIADSGWQPAWNTLLLADKAALEVALVDCENRPGATWADATQPQANRKPMNCVTWYEAFAFCAWDGGRLPTAAEFNLASVGGTQQRKYPWGADAIDANHASYCPNAGLTQCGYVAGIIIDAGSKPVGAGRWGNLDLIGSLREYALDYYTPIPNPCSDCAQLDDSQTTARAAMGMSWSDTQQAIDTFGLTTSLSARTSAGGFRCARDL